MTFKYFIIALGVFDFFLPISVMAVNKKIVEDKFIQCCKDLTNQTITADEAMKKINTAIFIDARSSEERDISIIPNAITPDQLTKEQKNKELIIYCTIGYRSGKLTARLISDGYKAKNLEGGILSWSWAQGPLMDSSGKHTKNIHTWSDDWNLIAPSYVIKND